MSKGSYVTLAGKVAVVTGVTRHAGLGAAIARELVEAGAAVFVTHFRRYDERQAWGVAEGEPESLLRALGANAAGIELDLSTPVCPRGSVRTGPVRGSGPSTFS